ncbi:MAG: Na(+)-translocating NADH-quinone reductase subunit C, partial [Porphyromonas sp.]|nr:Na(+)-translocating NADH-quinone reductase subunit C [Porphyromonas sp.]
MNKNSNTYVLLYSLVMVIIVAVLLAFTSQSLKDRKQNNANIDQMRQILSALHVTSSNDNAIDLYGATIVDAYLVDTEGNIVDDSRGVGVKDDAFTARLSDIPYSSTL